MKVHYRSASADKVSSDSVHETLQKLRRLNCSDKKLLLGLLFDWDPAERLQ